MVFSDSGDLQGAFYDNNSGVDYHVPVSGSTASPPRLRIAHVSVEMAPIAKVLLPCPFWEMSRFIFPAARSSVLALQACGVR